MPPKATEARGTEKENPLLAGEDDTGAALWALAHLATPMAIRVAATLRVADHLAGAPRTAAELAGAVGADTDALDRVLRHLAAKGVLRRDAEHRYALTALGRPLRADHPSGLRDMLDIEGAVGRAELAFVQLLHCVRTGDAGHPGQYGLSFWDDLAADPARAASFDARMGADARLRAPHIAAAHDWGSLGHVTDVGGGDGTLLTALLTAHPALRGTVVDLPETAAAARKTFAAAGLADRAEAVPGSFFDPLPVRGGGYLLSCVLHDWDDEAAGAVLRRCAEAAGPGGPVFVVERTAGDDRPPTTMDLRMLVYYGGRERSVRQLAALAADSGLRPAAVRPAGPLTIVEFTAAGTTGTRTKGKLQ
ncbi:methyltransferase [Streptomyces sp. NPDC053048]|uniref:methyltransferase n=1 Tax=Streptomyces sp. NPDC053048 TaxID=3365694 RepID=UPI0037D35B0F